MDGRRCPLAPPDTSGALPKCQTTRSESQHKEASRASLRVTQRLVSRTTARLCCIRPKDHEIPPGVPAREMLRAAPRRWLWYCCLEGAERTADAEMSGRLPDFICSGPSRAGPTGLHQFLIRHLQVYTPEAKA